MATILLLGTQWGDEGKGKIVDLLAGDMDLVVRFQGGANAGHTIVVKGEKLVLHHLPSGFLNPNCLNIIGNGCVVDPLSLLAEMEDARRRGISISQANLKISERAHLVTPLHRWFDVQSGGRVGTTGRGIGPCYADKIQRTGVRFIEFLDGSMKGHLWRQHEAALQLGKNMKWPEPPDFEAWFHGFSNALHAIHTFVAKVQFDVIQAHRLQLSILLEGAQGSMLDIDHGTYPFVTSSSTTVGGALTGIGVYLPLDWRIGVMKAYATRVGIGPFPTELHDATGVKLREIGHEYGATTGHPRRCGWLDLQLVKEACVVNGFNQLAITKLDCLSRFETIEVAIEHDPRGKPVYRSFEGWQSSISGLTSYERLPAKCREYLDFIEEFLEVPIFAVSVGPDREQTILRKKIWN